MHCLGAGRGGGEWEGWDEWEEGWRSGHDTGRGGPPLPQVRQGCGCGALRQPQPVATPAGARVAGIGGARGGHRNAGEDAGRARSRPKCPDRSPARAGKPAIPARFRPNPPPPTGQDGRRGGLPATRRSRRRQNDAPTAGPWPDARLATRPPPHRGGPGIPAAPRAADDHTAIPSSGRSLAARKSSPPPHWRFAMLSCPHRQGTTEQWQAHYAAPLMSPGKAKAAAAPKNSSQSLERRHFHGCEWTGNCRSSAYLPAILIRVGLGGAF